MVRIKICRVNDVETARALAALGVDFIGLHLVKTPTEERLRHLAAIISYCAMIGAVTQPVLVTKNINSEELTTTVQMLQPPLVQLHDAWELKDLRMFRESFPETTKIILVVDPVGGANEQIGEHLDLADYILLDRIRGGTGKVLPTENVTTTMRGFGHLPVFLAGGLDPNNVTAAIALHQPFAVDVQTALEIPASKGQKDIAKTIAFVKAVRGGLGPVVKIPSPGAVLCLSLTDYRLAELGRFDRRVMAAIDVAHLDHADGSVDVRFVRDSTKHAEELHHSFPLQPYDLHLFLLPLAPETVAEILDKYLRANPFMRAAFFYLDPLESAITTWPLHLCKEIAHVRGAGFALCFQARDLSPTVVQTVRRIIDGMSVDYMSVVGPPEKVSPRAYADIVGPFVSFLQQHLTGNVSVIVDRSITVSRLKALNNSQLSGAVGGQSIWGTSRPLETVQMFRRVLTLPAVI